MNISNKSTLTQLAFYTALAATIHIVEDLIMRMLPLPFIRVGFSNIVILYLILHHKIWEAFVVNISKTLLSGIVTLTLLSPSTILSLTAGITAIVIMVLVSWFHLGWVFTELVFVELSLIIDAVNYGSQHSYS
jgi:heptaprenyl diphosphate synthase